MGVFEIAVRTFAGVFAGVGAWLCCLWLLNSVPDGRVVSAIEDFVYRVGVMAGTYLLSISLFVTLALKL